MTTAGRRGGAGSGVRSVATGLWALLVIAATLTAGCAKGPESDATPDSAAPAGVLQGVVLDLAIRPLAGATVSIPAREDLGTQVTGDDGQFTFSGLPPGTLFVAASKAGYLSSVVQATVLAADSPAVQIVLEPLPEAQPYFVLESFRGLLECGVGSAPAFGLTAGCTVVAGAALYLACTGTPPVPPTGVCLGETNPYFISVVQGNMSMAQTEAVWTPTVPGQSELLIGSYVVDGGGEIVGSVPGAVGQSVLVRRLNQTVVQENHLGGANRLALYVNPGNSGAANVVLQQGYELFHTSTFFFTPPEPWVFAVDGPPVVPDTRIFA